MLRSTDGGLLWTPVASGISVDLLGVSFAPATSTGVAVSRTGRIWRTTDAGQTWTEVPGTPVTLNGVRFVSATVGIAVGNFGQMLRTVNGGLTWTPISSGTKNHLYSVSSIDAQTAVVAGEGGTLLLTTTGGI